MPSGVPNMAYVFGYFRYSWTLRVDLVAMLEHEQEREILPKADLDDGTLVYR